MDLAGARQRQEQHQKGECQRRHIEAEVRRCLDQGAAGPVDIAIVGMSAEVRTLGGDFDGDLWRAVIEVQVGVEMQAAPLGEVQRQQRQQRQGESPAPAHGVAHAGGCDVQTAWTCMIRGKMLSLTTQA